jgi:rare lipoprotein A
MASFYADKFEGRTTASGEIFSQQKLTAAHQTLPFGIKLRVTNLKNGKNVIVTVNDRGPYIAGRIIDLSKAAAECLGMLTAGITKVKIEIINK